MQRPHLPHLADETGQTLVELMIAAVVLVIGVLGTLTLLNGANAATSEARAREGATNLAREVVEAARGVSYEDLSSGTVVARLQAEPSLSDSGAAEGWQVSRRGRRYTLTATACVVDEGGGDGFGSHTGLPFCADSAETGTEDGDPDDYRRIAVEVRWAIGDQAGVVRQEGVINNPGSAYAAAVKTLQPISPALGEPFSVTSPVTTRIDFRASTTVTPDVVRWYVDDLLQGSATGSGSSWDFTWNLAGVADGAYLIGARAFEADGESGAGRAVTVTLNRFAPTPPSGLVGGRNGTFGIEFEWNPNAERDVTGYRVYRMAGAAPSSSDPQACETSANDQLPTSCRDTAASATGTLAYYVVAVAPARTGGGVEESQRPAVSQTLQVDDTNLAPRPPTGLTAARADGVVKLTWEAPPAPAAGESGDALRYFRIYRNGKAYGDRIDYTGSATTLSWIDRSPGSDANTYYVTAVDSKLAESVPAPLDGITR
jgi:type II secretory pathway pseudopilin PulG